MTIRKRSSRARVKDDLTIAFNEEALSSRGGFKQIRRLLDRSGFIERLRRLYSIRQFESDSGSVRMTLALVAMLIVGGRGLRHLAYPEQDPIARRFAGLHQLLTDRTVSHWLKDLGCPGIHDPLNDLPRELAYDSARHGGIRRATIDLDGGVLRTELFVDGAERCANTAWQPISGLTLNLMRQFQLHADAPVGSNGRKRTDRTASSSRRLARFASN